MSQLTMPNRALPPAPPEVIERLRQIEQAIRPHEGTLQVQMEHVLHGGMYARTCRVAANMAIVSVLIKTPTVLIVNGDCQVFAGSAWYALKGYNVMAASAGRKQIYVTATETEITMIFPTSARTVEEAEAEMTDEPDQLLSRRQSGNDLVTITGA